MTRIRWTSDKFAVAPACASTEDEVLALAAEAVPRYVEPHRSLVSTLEVTDAPVATGHLGGVLALVRMTRSFGCGLTDEYVQEVITRVNEGKTRGVSYRVVESGLHVFVEDALTDPPFHGLHDLVRAQGYRSLLAVPALSGRPGDRQREPLLRQAAQS